MVVMSVTSTRDLQSAIRKIETRDLLAKEQFLIIIISRIGRRRRRKEVHKQPIILIARDCTLLDRTTQPIDLLLHLSFLIVVNTMERWREASQCSGCSTACWDD
jgi:hypothetical protein